MIIGCFYIFILLIIAGICLILINGLLNEGGHIDRVIVGRNIERSEDIKTIKKLIMITLFVGALSVVVLAALILGVVVLLDISMAG